MKKYARHKGLNVRLYMGTLLLSALTSVSCTDKPAENNEHSIDIEPVMVSQIEMSFTENLELLDRLHQMILDEGIPVAPKMQDVNVSIPDILQKAGFEDVISQSGKGIIIYRSDDGESYKLLMYDTGDCGQAYKKRNEMVDRKGSRFKSGHDCRAYGYWSKTGAERY